MKKTAAAVPGGVMKAARPAKPAAPKKAAAPAHHPVSSKHKAAPSKKHKATAKHSAKTGLALHPDEVQCCAAQALAASLRLALGAIVYDEDVLALYWRTAAGPDEGASVLATLEAAHEHGIGGWFPAGWQPARGLDLERSVLLHLDLVSRPHAVTAAPDGSWWSWGEPWPASAFPGAVIEEAWAVTW